MANRKNRKSPSKNPNRKPEVIPALSQQNSIATLQIPLIVVKPVSSHKTEELSPEIVKRHSYVISEIKRSIVCAAITLLTLVVLYIIFK